MRLIILILTVILSGCHTKDGVIVKDAKGNLYLLQSQVCNECYSLNPINRSDIKEFILKIDSL